MHGMLLGGMPETPTVEVRIPEARALLALAIGVIVVAALYVAQEVFIPITLAVILSFILSPLVNGLGRVGTTFASAVNCPSTPGRAAGHWPRLRSAPRQWHPAAGG